MENKTDRELIADKNYTALYNRYNLKILKESMKVHKSDRDDFIQDSYFTVVNAVDKADLDREFESFNTILYYHMLGLVNQYLTLEYRESGNLSFQESQADTDLEHTPGSGDIVTNILSQNVDSPLMTYHPENIFTNDKESKLVETYNEFRNVLPDLHRKYVDLKIDRVPRDKMCEELGVRIHQLSHISDDVQAVASEVFGINYHEHVYPKRARRVMESANC